MALPAPPLFVYGTLRDPELRAAVIGRTIPSDAVLAATAPGFVAGTYPGRCYPGLLRLPGGAAEGLALLGLSAFELDLLDAYEGEEYRRNVLAVMIAEELHEAFAYLPTRPIPADSARWALVEWQERHKSAALIGERIAADALRQKLIAIRPN